MSRKDVCEKALAAHAAWKGKFRQYLAGQLQLDLATA